MYTNNLKDAYMKYNLIDYTPFIVPSTTTISFPPSDNKSHAGFTNVIEYHSTRFNHYPDFIDTLYKILRPLNTSIEVEVLYNNKETTSKDKTGTRNVLLS